MFKNAVIMAGGNGTRMKPLTEYIPKPLVKVDGTPLIDYNILELRVNRVENIHVTFGYKGSQVCNHLHIGVESLINTNGKDNAWWIFNTLLKNLDEPVFLSTCDIIYEIDLDKLFIDYLKKGCPACMIIPVEPMNGIDGDFINIENNNKIISLDRNKESNLYCSGLQVLNPKKINELLDNNITNFYYIWKDLIEKNELYCSSIKPTKWIAYDKLEQII